MAAPTKKCAFCMETLNVKRSNRCLDTEASKKQYQWAFDSLKIPMYGYACSLCATKLNRICKLNDDLKTKVLSIRGERDALLEKLKSMPGVTHNVQKTPKSLLKRRMNFTPTPKASKRTLFRTPESRKKHFTPSTGSTKPRTSITFPVLGYDKQTQTSKESQDFTVKVLIQIDN